MNAQRIKTLCLMLASLVLISPVAFAQNTKPGKLLPMVTGIPPTETTVGVVPVTAPVTAPAAVVVWAGPAVVRMPASLPPRKNCVP